MADTTVRTKTRDWGDWVREVDPEPTRQVVYEFSNGRKFYKPFREEGQSIYEGGNK